MAVLVVILVILMQEPLAMASNDTASPLASPTVNPTQGTHQLNKSSKGATPAQIQKTSSEKSVSIATSKQEDGNSKVTNLTMAEKNKVSTAQESVNSSSVGNAKTTHGTAHNATTVTKTPTPAADISTLHNRTTNETKAKSTLAPTTAASDNTRPNTSLSVMTGLTTHGQNNDTSASVIVTTTSLHFTTTTTNKPTQEQVTVLTSAKTNADSTKPKETNKQEDEHKPAAWMLPTFLSLAALCIVALITHLKWKNYSKNHRERSAPGSGDEGNALLRMTAV